MDKPQPIVKRPTYNFEYPHERKEFKVGRGFSLGELKAAGLKVEDAKKLGLRIDIRRKSVHNENVEALKKYLEEKSKETQSKS
ncbi:50S ribosomal protein L13e [Acidianus sulfidivorans JP7]|uniref:Large ribosomal subunit protein eL13 n=1 Tax=Acidianus sulfidivorans JP7 TaxID=619593 RepID=A0A2U9IJR9_9CREN|nr:50S ribosomal protein L13e [Acidianus sulfidivorans]AWR96289.1 50S ribosomal protein L13e [Acidianus sulfidivorans JP7]